MRIGLVLGGGGVTGAAWLVGALDALERETGWRATGAERIVGTSAGAVVGALVAGGIRPSEMATGRASSALHGYAAAEHEAQTLADRLGRLTIRPAAVPLVGVGSWRLALSTLCRPRRHAPGVLMAGWMPRGFLSTEPIKDLVESYVGPDWPAGGRFRAVAADYTSGRRVAFGRPDAPPAGLGDAVAASCAIPGLYRPVKIDGRRYVDGGICSPSNLDVLRRSDVDLVICLNPMSCRTRATPVAAPADILVGRMRRQLGRRLGHEARKLREDGKQVVLLQPAPEDVAMMGTNFLSGRRRDAIVEQARTSVAAAVRELREDGAPLPRRARTAARRAA